MCLKWDFFGIKGNCATICKQLQIRIISENIFSLILLIFGYRKLGYSMLPAILTVFGTCVLRLFWVYVICPMIPGFDNLMLIYPISWIITGAAVLIAYYIIQRKLFRPI